MTEIPTPGPLRIHSTTINHCNWLLNHAANSARQCEVFDDLPDGESEPKQKSALTSILFSVAAMEAFINELAHDCQQKINNGNDSEELRNFTWALRNAEDSNATTKYKFELAHLISAGEPPLRDRNPFADFFILFGLRNDIMHVKRPSTIVMDDDSLSTPIPRRVSTLIDRGLTRKMPDGYRTFWLVHLMTHRVAWWACNTAANICVHIASLVPHEGLSASFINTIQSSLQDEVG